MKQLKIINSILIIFILLISTVLVYLCIETKELSDNLKDKDNNIAESNDKNDSNNQIPEDKNTTDDDQEEDENSNNKNPSENSTTYTYDQLSEKVYSFESYYLILWNDKTYEYINNLNKEETMGTYTIDKNEIHLNYLFAIDRGDNKTSSTDDKATLTQGKKILKINSQSQLTDKENGITLKSVNQPAREGGRNFYTNLKGLLK